MKHFKIASVLTASTLLVSSLAFTSAEATTVSRGYLKHVYATGTTTSYTLTTEIVSSPNARTIIDGDDRTYQTRSENNGIVAFKNGGTGFIIGDHLIATAAHCVGGASGFPECEIYLYGSNGYKTGETLTPVEAHIPVDYTTNKTTIYDYALIVVEEDLSDRTHFSLGYAYEPMNDEFVDAKLYVTGYTDGINGDGNPND